MSHDGCTCAQVYVGLTPAEGVKNLRYDCPVHGVCPQCGGFLHDDYDCEAP